MSVDNMEVDNAMVDGTTDVDENGSLWVFLSWSRNALTHCVTHVLFTHRPFTFEHTSIISPCTAAAGRILSRAPTYPLRAKSRAFSRFWTCTDVCSAVCHWIE